MIRWEIWPLPLPVCVAHPPLLQLAYAKCKLPALAGNEGGYRAEKIKKEKEKEGFLPHPRTRGRWGVSGMILVFCFAQAGQ